MSTAYFLYRVPVQEFIAKHPEYRDKVLSDHPGVRHLIVSHDYVIPTAVSVRYPAKEWTDDTCLREFVQNAMDASEEATGKPTVEVYYDRRLGGTVIRDYGRGITEKAILMGGSEKPCWSRGYWGEGMKMSMAYLLDRYGLPTYAFSGDGTGFKSIDVGGTLTFVLFRHRERFTGTKVFVPKELPGLDTIVLDVERLPPEKVVFKVELPGRDCPHPRPNYIIDMSNRLYVAGIYVNETSKATALKSYFTYDLWWVRLHRGRTAPASADELERELSRVVEAMAAHPEVAERYLRPLVKVVTYGDVKALTFVEGSYHTVEGVIAPLHLLYGSFLSLASKLLGVPEDRVVVADSIKECVDAKALGLGCVLKEVVPPGASTLLQKLKPLAYVRSEILRNTVEESDIVPLWELSVDESVSYATARAVARLIMDSSIYLGGVSEIVVKELPGDLLGVTDGSIIYLSRRALLARRTAVETVCHELAHAFQVARKYRPEHLDRSFIEALEWIIGVLASRYSSFHDAMTLGLSCFPCFDTGCYTATVMTLRWLLSPSCLRTFLGRDAPFVGLHSSPPKPLTELYFDSKLYHFSVIVMPALVDRDGRVTAVGGLTASHCELMRKVRHLTREEYHRAVVEAADSLLGMVPSLLTEIMLNPAYKAADKTPAILVVAYHPSVGPNQREGYVLYAHAYPTREVAEAPSLRTMKPVAYLAESPFCKTI